MKNNGLTRILQNYSFAILTVLITVVSCGNGFVAEILPERNLTGADVSKPKVVSLPAPDTITVGEVTKLQDTNQSVEYAVSVVNNAPSSELSWQAHMSFSGLSSGTDYYVYARSAKKGGYNPGEYNVSDVIRFYTVYFYGNGNTSGAAPGSMTVLAGSMITVPMYGSLAKTASAFGSWNTQADGNGTNYAPGQQYPVTDNQNMYVRWLGAQSKGINIILPEDPAVITSGITISQTASGGYPYTGELTVTNSVNFTLVQWYYGNVLQGIGETLPLDARNIEYNEPGTHVISVRVWQDGAPYNYNISFEVLP